MLLALGLNIVVGYAGLLDLGYIAFYAMGAYAGVILGQIVSPVLGGFTYWAMLIPAALAGAVTGIALGFPVLRLRGDYLAIVTLGFGEIVRILLNNDFLGLSNGATGLPKASEVLARAVALRLAAGQHQVRDSLRAVRVRPEHVLVLRRARSDHHHASS